MKRALVVALLTLLVAAVAHYSFFVAVLFVERGPWLLPVLALPILALAVTAGRFDRWFSASSIWIPTPYLTLGIGLDLLFGLVLAGSESAVQLLLLAKALVLLCVAVVGWSLGRILKGGR